MRLSLYTFVKDGIYYDFHVEAMLRHHLPYVDEIIVNEGYSTDGTFERIRDIHPKVRVVRNHWDQSDPSSWSRKFKDQTRRMCTGDWCILLDCDEFVPEWELERMRAYLATTREDIIPMRYIHFYGNYRVYNASPEKHNWPWYKYTIHRNLPDLEVWGDGSNVRFVGGDDSPPPASTLFECHHFGFVRSAARLRQKWRSQRKRNFAARWDWMPGFFFDLFPHRWDDPQFLPDLRLYTGQVMKVVQADPEEFVRDGNMLVALLSRRDGATVPRP